MLDGTREALAPVLEQRAGVWEKAPPAAAESFDTALYLLSALHDSLRWRSEVDAEAKMKRMLGQIAERTQPASAALRDAALEAALAKTLAPVNEHLALTDRAARVHDEVLKISPEEYLLLCGKCKAPAERLRLHKDGVAFSRCTGAVPAPHYAAERAATLFAQLEREGAPSFCAALDKERHIIGWCPECRALYCPAHYETRETWSGSWLEALHGTCANGHRREIA